MHNSFQSEAQFIRNYRIAKLENPQIIEVQAYRTVVITTDILAMLCNLCQDFLTDILECNFEDNPRWLPTTSDNGYRHDYGPFGHIWEQSKNEMCLMCRMIIKYHHASKTYADGTVQKAVVYVGCAPGRQTFSVSTNTFLEKGGNRVGSHQFEIFKPSPSDLQPQTSDLLPLIPKFELDIKLDPRLVRNMLVDIASDPQTSGLFNLAREWLQRCLSSHPKCGNRMRKKLPTRVIDVGSADGSRKPRIAIGGRKRDQYVTLSHRWSQASREVATTRANIAERLQAIPLALFPRTFRDAVSITRRLGYRYLWIDSLCIIQDDKSDWEKECQKMCTVFENSSFTISALRAHDSPVFENTAFQVSSVRVGNGSDGLLNKRDMNKLITIHLAAGGVIAIRPTPPDFIEATGNSPMNNRGWILQERLLSRALLHFGHRQMYWECCSHTASVSWEGPDPLYLSQRHPR